MRLDTLAPAVAIILLAAGAAGPLAQAATPPTATITSPSEGATLTETGVVRISYSGYSPAAQNISGYFMLDGEPAGTFNARIASPNGTVFNASIAGAGSSSGAHALTARVFTDVDNPVDTPSVTILLDKRPTIADLAYSYDLDARRLHVSATVTDDGGSSNVQLRSGKNTTNATASGPIELVLAAPRHVGTYNATLEAQDSAGQVARASFTYVVADREAQLTIDNLVYERGGWLHLSGSADDADGLRSLHVSTPLGSGYASLANGSWSASIRVTPRLGSFNGTLLASDAWSGSTAMPFTFEIGGEVETIYERSVTTDNGTYQNYASLDLPAVLGGAFEICVGDCDSPSPSPLPVNASATGYSLLCANHGNPQCRAVTGRPITGGQFALCEPGGQALLREAVALADNATRSLTGRKAVCHDNYAALVNSTNGTTSSSPPGVFVAGRYNATGPNGTRPPCISVGEDTRCALDEPATFRLDLAWVQGPYQTVTVRLTGIRV